MTRTLEKWYPIGAGLPIGAALGYYLSHLCLGSNEVKDLLTVVINVSAIIAGFLGTALSVLLTIENRPVIKDLKDGGCYGPLLSYLLSAVRWSFALVVFCTLGLLLYPRLQVVTQKAFIVLWFAGAVATSLACWRVVQLFNEIVQTSSEEK